MVNQSGEESEKTSLNVKNYLNLISYILNLVITFGVGTFGLLGTPDQGELSEKYQTIITPAGLAFSIWGIIFTFQAIFAVLQMLPSLCGQPSFRNRPMVQQGVSYWYVAVCTFQAGWTFSFAYEIIPASLVFMVLLWISLMCLLISQYYVKLDPTTSSCSWQGLVEFWFLRFPFSVHGGWITAATALNVGVVVVDNEAGAATQLAVSILCLAVLHAISVWHLFGYKRPNYTIPCVLIWANGWIYAELQNPKQLIVDTFDQSIIDAVAYSAFSVAMVILTQLVVRVGFLLYNYIMGNSYLQEEIGEEEEENKSFFVHVFQK